jgi:hypothetical protein
MYHETVVQRRVEAVEKALKLKLKRRTVAEVDTMRARLEAVLDEEGKPKRNWLQEELDFIRDERLMVKCSYRYWLDRYATLQRDGSIGGGVGRVQLWSSQEMALAKIGEIELANWDARQRGEPVDGICVVLHKARQLGACLGAGHKVLLASLKWRNIEDIKLGDKVVALDEHIVGGSGCARKMRTATVTGLYSSIAPTMKVTLANGQRFTCTPHHRFLASRKYAHSRRAKLSWVEAKDLTTNHVLRTFTPLWQEHKTFEDGWFGGLIDGEGSMASASRSGVACCVAQAGGAVFDSVKDYLSKNNYPYRVEADYRKASDTSKLGNKIVFKACISDTGELFRLIGTTRPKRFINYDWWSGKELPNNRHTCGHDVAVVSVEPSVDQMVYDIETDTHTYVADGFCSHNTAVSRTLLVHRETNYPHIRGMAASIDDDKIMELYDRDKLCIDNLPFYLKPSMSYDVKAAHMYFDKLDSRMLYQQSRQQSGLGQGRQFDIAHLTECAFWPYPNMIELDFFPALPLGINTLCILESTANGLGGWWYDFTEDVRKGLQRRWKYIFAPWYIESKKNRAQPPLDWTPSEMTMQHARKVYETSREYTGRDVLLDKSQLYWYETERNAALRRGKLNLFLTNFCATPEESFQHTGNSQFSVEVLERIRLGTLNPHYYELNVPSCQ